MALKGVAGYHARRVAPCIALGGLMLFLKHLHLQDFLFAACAALCGVVLILFLASIFRRRDLENSGYAGDHTIDVARRCLPVTDADSHGATTTPGCAGKEGLS
jgi:hypothetical protein